MVRATNVFFLNVKGSDFYRPVLMQGVFINC